MTRAVRVFRTGSIYRLRLVLACLAAALLAGLLLRPLLVDWEQSERQKTELFWNGYVQMYMDLAGDVDGLAERLAVQGYLHAWDRGLSLIWFNQEGKREILLGEGSDSRPGRQLPVMRDRQIVGYTQVWFTAPPWLPYMQYGMPGGLALLLYGLGEWRKAVLTKARAKERIVLAEELAAYLTGTVESREHGGAAGSRGHSGISSSRGHDGTAGEQSHGGAEVARGHSGTGDSWGHAGSKAPVLPWSDGKADADEAWAAVLTGVHDILARNESLETVRRSMVADIAHELRTPISIMRTTLDHALQAGASLDPAKTASLHDETLRLTRLVRELQELSLAESGHLPLDKSWFVLSEVVEEVLETLAVEGEERGIVYSLEDVGSTMLYGDKSRIRQIVINLAGNAFRHAGSKVEVHILTEGSFVVLEVGDDGLGMEQEELDSVFERFYRSASTDTMQRKERSSGLGLGLAIVREFARAHGGEATVQSVYGQGAIFTVKIPVMEE